MTSHFVQYRSNTGEGSWFPWVSRNTLKWLLRARSVKNGEPTDEPTNVSYPSELPCCLPLGSFSNSQIVNDKGQYASCWSCEDGDKVNWAATGERRTVLISGKSTVFNYRHWVNRMWLPSLSRAPRVSRAIPNTPGPPHVWCMIAAWKGFDVSSFVPLQAGMGKIFTPDFSTFGPCQASSVVLVPPIEHFLR